MEMSLHMIMRVEWGCCQFRRYGVLTMPDASTKAWWGLMIMSGVGTTYMMGGTFGYRSGSHKDTGMLYFAPCTGE